MGLDLYAGDWQLSVGRFAEEMGVPFSIVGEHPTKPGEGEDPVAARADVLRWKADLIAGHGHRFPDGLDWDESPRAPYFIEKPGWSGFEGLRSWAAYLEHPGLPRPRLTIRGGEDPAIKRSLESTRFPNLIPFIGLWMPCRLSQPFQCEDIEGKMTVIGSSVELLEERKAVNDAGWRLDLDAAAGELDDAWRQAGPFEHDARYGFWFVLKIVREAVRHRLPLLKDY